MVSGGVALLLLAAAIALVKVFAGRGGMKAFLVLLAASFAFGLAAGIPAPEVARGISNGFGGTMSNIGIVVIAGAMLGVILEKTGASRTIASVILKPVRGKASPAAISLAGCLVSAPVSCDTGFVVLRPVCAALSKESGTSLPLLAAALATSLLAGNCLLPPGAGPLAAARILGADWGRTLLLGAAAAIPAVLSGCAWAKFASGKRRAEGKESAGKESADENVPPRLPGIFPSFLPVMLPVVLILLDSIANLPSKPFGGGFLYSTLSFLGHPATALSAGLAASFPLAGKARMRECLEDWLGEGMKEAAAVLALAGAGGAFGQIVSASPAVDFAGAGQTLGSLGILMPFLLAAVFKTAQGSSMAAILVVSGIMAPLTRPMGLDPALVVLAIGSGSMVLSHVNDPYFWMVSGFSGMSARDAGGTFSAASAVAGTVAFVVVVLMSFVVKPVL